MGQALRQGHEELNAELARTRHRQQQIECEIKRLVDAIAQGQASQSFMAAIGERETELRAVTNRLLEPGPGSLQARLDELRTFAVSRLTKIRELISHPESVDLARAELAEHFVTFTLEPTVGRRTGVSCSWQSRLLWRRSDGANAWKWTRWKKDSSLSSS